MYNPQQTPSVWALVFKLEELPASYIFQINKKLIEIYSWTKFSYTYSIYIYTKDDPFNGMPLLVWDNSWCVRIIIDKPICKMNIISQKFHALESFDTIINMYESFVFLANGFGCRASSSFSPLSCCSSLFPKFGVS